MSQTPDISTRKEKVSDPKFQDSNSSKSLDLTEKLSNNSSTPMSQTSDNSIPANKNIPENFNDKEVETFGINDSLSDDDGKISPHLSDYENEESYAPNEISSNVEANVKSQSKESCSELPNSPLSDKISKLEPIPRKAPLKIPSPSVPKHVTNITPVTDAKPETPKDTSKESCLDSVLNDTTILTEKQKRELMKLEAMKELEENRKHINHEEINQAQIMREFEEWMTSDDN